MTSLGRYQLNASHVIILTKFMLNEAAKWLCNTNICENIVSVSLTSHQAVHAKLPDTVIYILNLKKTASASKKLL